LGKFSSFGSLGTGTGWLAAGLIAEYFAIKGVFTFSAVIFAISFLISMTFPPMPKRRYKVPFFPVNLFRRYLSIFLSYLIRHIGASAVWIIYPLYLQSLGISYFWISVLYAINPFGQFILMYTVTDKLSANRLMSLGLLFSATAFFSMSLAGNAWHIVPVQLLVAASWSCLYVGALRYVTEGDVRKVTTTGLLNSIIYLGNIVGPLAWGAISEITGSHRGNMMVAAVTALSSFFLYELLARKKTGE